MHSMKITCAFACMAIAMFCFTSTARAEGGDGCPDGYAMGARPYMDSSGAMAQNFGCYPIQYRVEKYWGAFAYAMHGTTITSAANWNAATSKQAEKSAMSNCKKQLKQQAVKAKCVLAGSGYNGTGWIAWGVASRLFFGLGKEDALAECQNAGIQKCSIYAKFISDGTDASRVEYFDGGAADGSPPSTW